MAISDPRVAAQGAGLRVPLGQCLHRQVPPPLPRAPLPQRPPSLALPPLGRPPEPAHFQPSHANVVGPPRRISVLARWPYVWSRDGGKGGDRKHIGAAGCALRWTQLTSALRSRDRRLCMGCEVRPLGHAARTPLLRHAEQRGSVRVVCTVGKRLWAAFARRYLRIRRYRSLWCMHAELCGSDSLPGHRRRQGQQTL